MKLYVHNKKHNKLLGMIDLGNLSGSTMTTIDSIIDFLEAMGITDRSSKLILADSHRVVVGDDLGHEDDEIIFGRGFR